VHVAARQRLGDQGVGPGEQVVDVGGGGDRPVGAVAPRRVGVADQPAALPRDHEEDALLGAGEDAGVHAQAVAGHEDVDALGGDDPSGRGAAGQVAQAVGPHAGRAGHVTGAQQQRIAGLLVDRLDLAGTAEAGHPHARGDERAVGGGRAGDGDDHAGVVLGGVVELDGADERVGAQRGRDLERAALGEMAVAGNGPSAADGVVEDQPGAEVRALPAAAAQRPQERHRRHEVGREPREQQLALAQRLAHEPEVAHLEVPQAAVDELARCAGGAGREVARLDERDAQAARGGVERRPGAGDAAPDDEHVQVAGRRRLDRPAARRRVEPAHGAALLKSGLSASYSARCRRWRSS
jgi:hypothetical protein